MPTPLTRPQHRSAGHTDAGGSSTRDDAAAAAGAANDDNDDDADDADDANDASDMRWDLRRLSVQQQRTIDSDSVDTAGDGVTAFQRY